MTHMASFKALVKKEIHRFTSIWVQTIFGPVTTAILYQLIFGERVAQTVANVHNIAYSVFLIPGIVMMQVLLNAFGNGSSSLIQAKYHGNIIFLLMAPISPLFMYAAFLIASIIRGVVVGFAVMMAIGFFGISWPVAPVALVYFLIFGAAITAGLGLIAGILCDKFDQLAAFESFIVVPLVYLAGVFFHPDSTRGAWQLLSRLDPFLYIVDGFRYGLIGHADYDVIFGAIFIGIFALVVNLCGYLLLKCGVKIKH